MRRLLGLSLSAIVLAACSGATDTSATDQGPPSGDTGGGADASSPQADGSSSPTHWDGAAPPSNSDGGSPPSTTDASPPPPPPGHDAGPPPPPPPPTDGGSGDGTPTRQPCTGSFGSSLSSGHARLDGYLVTIIPPGQGKQCNGDSSHVHLQILMNGSVYDVAANVDGNETEIDHPMVGAGWSEGWHTQDGLDYPSQLGVSSSQFSLSGVSAVANEVEQRLAQANHLSVFCTGYGATGCHLVHRSSGHDGAIVIDPLSASPHWLLFDFSGDNF